MEFVTLIIVVPVLFLWVATGVRFVGAIFSVRLRGHIAAHPIFHCIWLLAAILTFITAIFPYNSRPRHPQMLMVKMKMARLELAAKAYFAEYGSYPSGDNQAIVRTLQSDNPRRIVFVELSARDLNKQGEVVDLWGTPFQFSFARGQPQIRSAGPDGLFNTDDDFLSPDLSQDKVAPH
jgi:hypothetical protein